ncbi:ribonuclease domain-containing protein [Chondromyces crocatus]|uniref:Uncharacterized protein n=1 Tax=Chondromyces crocatus TaxID=52 RepID=A0A0K1ECV1_CHOCO|nr:ribonuclease domain-containing protein [Chondromyces crocatus]AKT38695.1 uncharacterized protein CMC5_028430 [Chondromyces crocatus]
MTASPSRNEPSAETPPEDEGPALLASTPAVETLLAHEAETRVESGGSSGSAVIAPPAPSEGLDDQASDQASVISDGVDGPSCLDTPRGPPRRIVDGVRVEDRRDDIVLEGPIDLGPTLDRIAAGGSYPHRNDGSTFSNRPLPGSTEPPLPEEPYGYYTEYVHPTPGISGAGPQRLIVGRCGEVYYTPDHYQTFIPLN